jgi:hypothetical protein
MQPELLIPVVAFLLVAAALVLILRRAGRLVAQTREADAFRNNVADLARRVDASTSVIIEAVDGVRRRRGSAETIGDQLAAALDAVRRYSGEARQLRPPPYGINQHARLVGELERAERALEMVEHGCSILTAARIGGRELEAQTAIKRGYLNVLHAREAVLQVATEVSAYRPQAGMSWLVRRRQA